MTGRRGSRRVGVNVGGRITGREGKREDWMTGMRGGKIAGTTERER